MKLLTFKKNLNVIADERHLPAEGVRFSREPDKSFRADFADGTVVIGSYYTSQMRIEKRKVAGF